MWKSLKEIISKKPLLDKIAKRKRKEALIKKFLEENRLNSVDFKISNSKIYFYCPDHSTLNLLKLNEEKIREILFSEEPLSVFRYFLKKD